MKKVKKTESIQNYYKLQECDDVFSVPSLDVPNKFWSYGEYELVGHGKQTNAECGRFKRFDGCLNVEAHNSARWFMPD
jgi:hypothetical protein